MFIKGYIRYLLLVFLLGLCVLNPAQQNNLRFEHLNSSNGLSQNLIFDIVQDSLGFMWFATKDGLNRFDGYEFKVFRNDINDSTTISDNFITCLLIDSNGRLWAGTRNGLNIYNPERENFIRFNVGSSGINIKLNQIQAIKEEAPGNIWAAYRNGSFLHIISDENNNYSAKTYQMNFQCEQCELHDFAIDKKNNFWLGCGDGLWKTKLDKSEQFIESEKISNKTTRTLFTYSNNLWFGTNGQLNYININDKINKIISYNLFGDIDKFDSWLYSVNKIIAFDSSKLFIASANGLIEFYTKTIKIYVNQSQLNDPSTLSTNNLRSVYIDKSNNLWIGTGGYGINKTNLAVNKFEYFPCQYGVNQTLSIMEIKEKSAGEIWFTNMGSLLFNLSLETGEVKPISNLSRQELVYDFIFMPDGSNYRIKSSSIEKYNSNQKLIESFSVPSLNQLQPLLQKIISHNSNNLWIAARNGILKFDTIKKIFEFFKYPITGDFLVLSVYPGNNNDLWIGTEVGLFRFNKNNSDWQIFKKNKKSLSNERVKSICYDPINPDKYIWFGTDGGGLNKLNFETLEFKIFTTKDGLPNNVVYGILTDAENNLWLSTNNGLSCFNTLTEQFTNYNIFDGLQDNEFNSNSYFKSADGKLYFGGINGITAFYPDELSINKSLPNIVITGFKIFNKNVSFLQDDSPIDKSITYTKNIELPYNQSNFSFTFAALDFTASKNNKYKYKLEGFDDNWIDNGTSREAYYTNIHAGRYIFRAAGSNNDNIWNEKGIQLNIIISPPFWDTWWAYLIYILTAISVLYWIFRYQKNRLILAQKIELSEIEKEKFIELNNLKTKFLTNITHEFRTPLTLVIGPVENLLAKAKDKDYINTLDGVRNNAKHLLKLVNQLLELSRLDKEKLPINLTLGDLVGFVTENISMVHSLAAQKGISINFNSEHKFINAYFDPDLVQKIISNLINNSIKYTPIDGMINVSLNIFENKSDKARIIIEDNGIGIPSDELKNIFNPFFRSNSSKLFNTDGFGIGLALTKELIDLMGGEISAVSEPNVKTVFTVELPMKIESFSNEKIEIFYKPRITEARIDNENLVLDESTEVDDKIILIVDDIAEMRNYITAIAVDEFKVITAADGLTGFEKALKYLPDLIVSDVMMPGISGYDFVVKLKNEEITSHIPVIMLTARADEQSKLLGLEIGVDEYLTKPFSTIEFMTRVKNLIKNREKLKIKFGSVKNDELQKPKSKDDIFLEKLTDFIEANIEKENITVEELAENLNLSYSQVYRKIKSITNITAVQFIQKCRLKKAAELLQSKAGNVSEIAFMVGFQNPSYFAQVFKKEYNCTPNEFIQKK